MCVLPWQRDASKERRLPAAAEVDLEAYTRNARRSERCGGRLGNFDGAVEKVFAGSKELEAAAEIVGGVGVETEVAVQ